MVTPNKKMNTKGIGIEALMIVFTVTLALALNEWRSVIKEDEIKKKS
ncbi:MAG: hypothetical protein AAF693_18460 [Bacteroidota bacterium]